ncbi:glycosyl hydrolase 108 family protein [Candidatus Methylacidithermus pantelleriae]|uniref:TtsA-like Glycoside hydrolase family 108 domain-containing protein n=1 Tax=Candidatus Methylacidithermus pantelleriae TaxID=2744239 RepID=A0A8J2BUQ4_9BACT|nr:glycosyl hydrolase 108 family protein [Candidatus Methylacidithermus pantelleriae]CAF0700543.1 hypothetical protein MPNT_380007 [Candidatus Methylacidithermus pantelleriae]
MTYGSDLEKLVRAFSISVVLWQEIEWEGENAKTEHDPHDPGGATKFGVDLRSHPGLRIEDLSFEKAWEIYEKEWADCGAHRLRPSLAFLVFNAGVNIGYRKAITLLQAAAGVEQDGVIGEKTVEASKEVKDWQFISKWDGYYYGLSIVLRERFLEGWVTRVRKAYDAVRFLNNYAP